MRELLRLVHIHAHIHTKGHRGAWRCRVRSLLLRKAVDWVSRLGLICVVGPCFCASRTSSAHQRIIQYSWEFLCASCKKVGRFQLEKASQMSSKYGLLGHPFLSLLHGPGEVGRALPEKKSTQMRAPNYKVTQRWSVRLIYFLLMTFLRNSSLSVHPERRQR